MKNKCGFLKTLRLGSRDIFTFISFSVLSFLGKICTCKELNILQSEHFIMAFRKKLPLNYANCLNQLDKYECEQNAKCCWKFVDMHVIIFISLIVSKRSVRTPGKHGFSISALALRCLSVLCCFCYCYCQSIWQQCTQSHEKISGWNVVCWLIMSSLIIFIVF